MRLTNWLIRNREGNKLGNVAARAVFGIIIFYFFFKKSHSDGKLKHSLPSKLSGTHELARDLSSQLAFLDLDQSSSEEPQISCSQRQSSGEVGGKTNQLSQHKLGQESRDSDSEKGERRQEKRISYLIEEKEEIFQPKAGIPEDSLVSTSTEDILFQKDDSANVYPLVSVTCLLISPRALRVL